MRQTTISEDRLEKLLRDEEMLRLLHEGGVDNWSYYSQALEPLHKKQEIDEAIEDFEDELNEILIHADVEYPAGPDAGHAIYYSSSELRVALLKLIEDVEDIKER